MDPFRRLLRSPLGWFTVVLFEYLVVIAVFRLLWPDGAPARAGAGLLAVVVGLTGANVWLARRFRGGD